MTISTTVDPLYDDSPENLQRIAHSLQTFVTSILWRYGLASYTDEVMANVTSELWLSMDNWHKYGDQRPPLDQWAGGVAKNVIREFRRYFAPRTFSDAEGKREVSLDVLIGYGVEDFEAIEPATDLDPETKHLYKMLKSAIVRTHGTQYWDRVVANVTHKKRGVNFRSTVIEILEQIDHLMSVEQ